MLALITSIVPARFLLLVAGAAAVLGGGWWWLHERDLAAQQVYVAQQKILVAQQTAADQNKIIQGLQQQAAHLSQAANEAAAIKGAVHAVPSSRACVDSGAGRAFLGALRAVPGASPSAKTAHPR